MADDSETCSVNVRKFPKELRRDLHRICIELEEEIQDLIPRYVREGIARDREKLRKKTGPKAGKHEWL